MSFLQQTSESFVSDDMSWLASRHGIMEARSVTLDTSTFTPGTHYPNGMFLAGIALTYNSTSKMYEPWATTKALAGFLFAGVPAPLVNTVDVAAAMLDHCKVIAAKLPFAVDATGLGTAAGRILAY